MKHEIVLATGNTGKIQEFQHLLPQYNCVPQAKLNITDVEETGQTFIENAIIKARHASQQARTAVIADDSGLVVPALDGKPGIYSARFAGPHASSKENIQKLLAYLKNNDTHRDAYFYCVIVFMTHAEDPTPIVGTGMLKGEISEAPSGKNGFGYDPIFYLETQKTTLANLSANEKNQISHRAKAIQSLLKQWDYQ